jgi:hypothetical protein
MGVEFKKKDRDYARAGDRNANYILNAKGHKAPKQSEDYHPSAVLGACARCKRLGSVIFPPGTFNWNIADNLMSRQKAIIYCPQCNRNTEFIPVPPDKGPEEALEWIRKQEKMLKKRELSGHRDTALTKIF